MTRVIAQVRSVSELRGLSLEVPPGSSGRIVIEGTGLGVAADLAGAETVWRQVMGQHGFSVTDVYGDGISRAIVEWRTALGGATRQFQAVPLQAQMMSRWGRAPGPQFAVQGLGLLIGVAIVAVLLVLGWVVLKQITILLYGGAEGGGLGGGNLLPLLMLAGIALVVLTGTKVRRTG